VFTKDFLVIWWVNAAATAASYAFAYLKPSDAYGVDENGEEKSSLPPVLIKAFKALDYGSGRERGERK
jgi:hypothetical protein